MRIMDTPHQPSDEDALDLLLGRAREFILGLLGLIDSVLERLGTAPMSARLTHHLMRRALLPAEAALRRAILLIATTLPAPAPRAVPVKAFPKTGIPSRKGALIARAPVFCMREPQPRAPKAPKQASLPEHLLPRITLLTDSVLRARSIPESAKIPTQPGDPAMRFHRRLTALRAAYENPVREAERWLRRHAVRPEISETVLAPAKIPGARKSLGVFNNDLLRELTRSARLSLHPNTS